MPSRDQKNARITLVQLIEVLLATDPDTPHRPVVVVASPEVSGLETSPLHWRRESLTGDIKQAKDLIIAENTDLILIPPYLRHDKLDAATRAGFPRFDLQEVITAVILPELPQSSRVLLIVPDVTVTASSREHARQQMFADWQPDIVMHLENQTIFPDVHSALRLAVVRLISRKKTNLKQRLVKISGNISADEIARDLRQLLVQEYGRTKYGYVLDDVLPPAASLGFREHHPDRKASHEKLEIIGQTTPLKDLFEVFYGNRIEPSATGSPSTGGSRGLIVRARHITREGDIVFDLFESIDATGKRSLKPGDLIMREIYRDTQNGLLVASVPDMQKTLIPAHYTLVLRPREDLPPGGIEFIAAYLRSGYADTILGLESGQLHISLRRLLELPVPQPNAAMRQAIADLRYAADLFLRWRNESLTVVRQIFDEQDLDRAQSRAISVGRRVRQRASAAASLDDLGTRLRARLPYPLAVRWRRVEASRPDGAGYDEILGSAEALLCFCAIVGWLMARYSGIDIPYLQNIRQRFKTTGHGMNFGDWVSILGNLASRRNRHRISSDTPFRDVIELLSDKEIDRARRELKSRRDGSAHGRRPEPGEISDVYSSLRADLEVLFAGAEWLSEYSLRLVIETRWDSLAGVAEVTYRELMGDHAVVPESSQRLDEILETGSLYLVDRLGRYHLLRPLMHAGICPTCRRLAVFVFDRWHASSDVAEYRALDHGHTLEVPGAADALRSVGFLPANIH
ncbi:hypothetical protein AB0B56_10465 [Streptosporangium canum]|uniref:hypothetical protein n=1 Tax=Streptosporangium canum TaxID=324952 RepID=UPI00343C77EF